MGDFPINRRRFFLPIRTNPNSGLLNVNYRFDIESIRDPDGFSNIVGRIYDDISQITSNISSPNISLGVTGTFLLRNRSNGNERIFQGQFSLNSPNDSHMMRSFVPYSGIRREISSALTESLSEEQIYNSLMRPYLSSSWVLVKINSLVVQFQVYIPNKERTIGNFNEINDSI